MRNAIIGFMTGAIILSGFAITANAKPPFKVKPGNDNHTHSCPPGLMDKGCMPPGQAKKYEIGQPIYGDYVRINDYRLYRLDPPPKCHYYARIDRDIVLVAEPTQNVVQLINVLVEILE